MGKKDKEHQMDLFVELSDEKGHTQTEMLEKLDMLLPNLSKMCNDLGKKG